MNLASATLESGPVVVASVRDVTEARAQAARLRDSLDLVTGILAAATEQAIITLDLEGRIETFSRGAELMCGFRADEVVGAPVGVLYGGVPAGPGVTWGADAADPLGAPVPTLVEQRIASTRPGVFVTKDGRRRDVLLSITVRQAGSEPRGLILVATDQSQRLEDEARVAASEERFRLSFERSPVGCALVSLAPGPPGRFIKVNPALRTFLGYEEGELLEATLGDLTHPEDLPLVVAAFDGLLRGEEVHELIEHRFLHADGSTVWGETSLGTVLTEDGGRTTYVVAQTADITTRKVAEAELVHNALHDSLTGLPNRALISERITQALARARRTGSTVGVFYVDLDNFKDINDSLGHAAGDELLVEVAHRLAGCMRDTDLAGRLGGDEFVIVCEELERTEDITSVADRVAAAVAVQLPLAGRMVTASASIGIAHTRDPATDPEDLLREADIAMYRAKSNGRGRYEFSDPALQLRAVRQVELEADLRATLAAQAVAGDDAVDLAVRTTPALGSRNPAEMRHPHAGRLFLEYQPCFDGRSGRLVACEALLRWDHPERGVLTPGQFLDVAEDRVLMTPLGAWVLREAVGQAASWSARYGDDAPEVWVNVSAGQLGRFSETVAEVLDETGLPAHLLWLELTERQALSSATAVLDDLHALPGLGVRLAIDDFGTGYAGLDYLRRLPVAALKVDASYVAAIGADPAGAALVSTVVNLGHALDLTVVAEGVETSEQRDAVVELGADVLQGYLLGRPGAPEQVERILAERGARPA